MGWENLGRRSGRNCGPGGDVSVSMRKRNLAVGGFTLVVTLVVLAPFIIGVVWFEAGMPGLPTP